MDPEDDKKQKRIGSKVRLVSRKMLKTEDEDEEQSRGKWQGTVKTAAKAPEDRDPGARSSRQDRKGDAQEPEVAGKTASRCRQDRKGNAQEPEVAGKTAILGWPPAASVCASASGSGSLSVPEPVEKPRLLRVCMLVRGGPPPRHVGPDKHSGFRTRCKDKGRSFAKAMLRGPMQRQRFWVAKAVAKVAVAKPAAAAPSTLERAMQEGGPVFPLLGNAGANDLRGIRAGGYDKCTPLSAKTTKELSRADAILRKQPKAAQSSPEHSPKQPRATQSSPKQPRAAQSNPKQLKAARAAQSSPKQTKANQSSPEQPKAAQSSPVVSARRSQSPKLLPKPPASCPPLHLRIESPLHLRIDYLVSRRASGMTADDCSHDEMIIYQSIVDEIGEKKVKDCSRDELIIYKNLSS
jgi:hypothetical protein